MNTLNSLIYVVTVAGLLGCGGGNTSSGVNTPTTTVNTTPGGTSNGGLKGVATQANTTGTDAMYPNVAVAHDGDALVVWTEVVPPTNTNVIGESKVLARAYRASDHAWQPTETLGAGGGSPFTPQARVITNHAGAFMVVWAQQGADLAHINPHVYAKTFHSANSTWSDTVTVDRAASAMFPDAAMDSSGNAIIAWRQNSGAAADQNGIFGAHYSASGNTWHGPDRIQGSTVGGNDTIKVAMHSGGTGVAAWTEQGTTVNRLMASEYSGGWQTARELTSTSDFIAAGDVALTMINANEAWCVWKENADIIGRHLTGGVWDVNVQPFGKASLTGGMPRMASNNSGKAILVYESDDGLAVYNNIRARVYGNGSWSNDILNVHNDVLVQPTVAFNGRGEALAVWHQLAAHSTADLQARYYDGAAWATTVSTLAVPTPKRGDSNNPQLGLADDASVVTVFTEGNTQGGSVYYNQFVMP